MRPNRLLALVTLAVVATLSVLWIKDRGGPVVDEQGAVNPTTWFAPSWEDALGGDAPTPEGAAIDLTQVASLTDIPPQHRLAVARLAADIATASASGLNHALYGTYFARNHPVIAAPELPPSGASARYCSDVEIVATSSFLLPIAPSGSFVKSLVLWRGSCPFPPPSISSIEGSPIYVAFVYLARSDVYPHETAPELLAAYNGWVPIRPTEMPGATSWSRPIPTPPAPWEVAEVEGCSLAGVLVRTEVAAAYAGLCAEARAQGVQLLAIDGLRNAEEQRRRFDAAVQEFGSERAARVRVAFSDGERCESTHCAGEALDVSPGDVITTWLGMVVGCIEPSGVFTGAPCTPGAQPVSRIERYGFTRPNPTYPFHLEYALGTLSIDAELYGDCTPGAVDVRDQVQLVFQCRSMEAGLSRAEAISAGPIAVAIAECSSQLNPAASSFDGRFRTAANPATGYPDDRSGLFAISSAVAERWMAPNSSLRTPLTNIDIAARLYVEERVWGRWGWDPFACAAADDGTVQRSVLAQ